MLNAVLICYACASLMPFAIPLMVRGEKQSGTVRIACASGFGMTLLFVVLSVFPIVEEQSWGLFTVRMLALVGSLQFAGALLYRSAWVFRTLTFSYSSSKVGRLPRPAS